METNNKNSNYSALMIPEKSKNNSGDNSVINNGDIGDKTGENVVTTNTYSPKRTFDERKKGKVDPLACMSIVLFLIGLILLFKAIIDKWKLSKMGIMGI
jgi:hypothetical protein